MDETTVNTNIDELVAGASSICITGHVRPDGDCVGSCLGLASYLKDNFGLKADVFLEDFSSELRILPGAEDINPEVPEDKAYDVFFSLDTSEPERIGAGKERQPYAQRTVVIDHHMTNPGGTGNPDIIYPGYSSCGEVLYTLMREDAISKNTAACLYTALVHDTGIFQYASVTQKTMERAGRLMASGIDFPHLINCTYLEQSLERQKLHGLALSRCKLTSDGQGIWSYVRLSDMKKIGCTPLDADGIAEALRITKGIDYSIALYESEPGCYKASFRSKGETNVAALASAFGGGGHKLASGCSFTGLTPNKIMSLLEERLAQQRAAQSD